MNKKKLLLISAAFTAASATSAVATINHTLEMNDIALSHDTSNAVSDFHNIPVSDVMIATYASYFVGATNDGNTPKPDLGMRAENTYGMVKALEENFTGDNAPWVILDSLSDGRNGSRIGENMGGANFLTLYHKDTHQVVISMPGMEYDYSLNDTLEDAQQLFSGSLEQTQALKSYTDDIMFRIETNDFKDELGQTFKIDGDKPIIISHSLGSKPIHTMAIAGFETIIIEPRPITEWYVSDLQNLYQETFGSSKSTDEIIANIDAHTITVRAGHANIWNSPVLPWETVHETPNTYIYGTGEDARFADRHVGGHHAAEVFTPSLMIAINPNSAAKDAPKGLPNMRIERLKR